MLSTTHRTVCVPLTAALLFCAFALRGQTATTYSVQRDDYNNTSAADRYGGCNRVASVYVTVGT